jgi:hypothetical protein
MTLRIVNCKFSANTIDEKTYRKIGNQRFAEYALWAMLARVKIDTGESLRLRQASCASAVRRQPAQIGETKMIDHFSLKTRPRTRAFFAAAVAAGAFLTLAPAATAFADTAINKIGSDLSGAANTAGSNLQSALGGNGNNAQTGGGLNGLNLQSVIGRTGSNAQTALGSLGCNLTGGHLSGGACVH